MIPITFTRNDAFSNLFNSIILAGHFSIPEVLIVFGNKAFRGNRCRHISADSFDGIDSPNFPALVSFGIDINIKWDLVMRRDSN
jgi:lysophospholipase